MRKEVIQIRLETESGYNAECKESCVELIVDTVVFRTQIMSQENRHRELSDHSQDFPGGYVCCNLIVWF